MMRYRLLVGTVMVGALLASGCALIRDLRRAFSPPPGVVPASLRLSGASARAAGIGTADLIALREKNIANLVAMREKGIPDVPPPGDILKCFARPESYDVYVGVKDDRYVVRVIPVSERCLAGGAEIYGGGATYEISMQDYSVLKTIYDE